MKPSITSALALIVAAILPAAAVAAPTLRVGTAIAPTVKAVQIAEPSDSTGRGWLYGFSPLRGSLRFRDDGTNLTVIGQATGFDPSLQFVTLLYATPSVRVGALACIPPASNPYLPPQMFVAYWLPVGATRRTLYAVKTGASYVSLQSIATASIRYDSTPQVGNPAATTQTPARYWLQVCANV